MDHRLKNSLISIAAVIVLALLVVGFLSNFKQTTRRIFTSYGPKAKENDYLAAGWLMENLGLTVTFFKNSSLLDRLPDSGGTVFIPVSRDSFTQDQIDDLQNWIKEGGSLVVAAELPSEESVPCMDILLDYFGVNTAFFEPGEYESELDTITGGCTSIPLYDPHTGESRTDLSVDIYSQIELIDQQDRAFWSAPESHTMLLHIKYGKGLFTVLADAGFMTNSRIGEADNARFLWYLAQELGYNGEVFLVYGEDFPPLLQIITRRGWPVLISLALLIASGIWFVAPRLGPVLRIEAPVRRDILEHLDASGYFLWRQGHASALIATVRHAVKQSISRKHPSWSRLSPPKQLQRLETLLGLDKEQLEPLFVEQKVWKEKQFLETIKRIERIRSSL